MCGLCESRSVEGLHVESLVWVVTSCEGSSCRSIPGGASARVFPVPLPTRTPTTRDTKTSLFSDPLVVLLLPSGRTLVSCPPHRRRLATLEDDYCLSLVFLVFRNDPLLFSLSTTPVDPKMISVISQVEVPTGTSGCRVLWLEGQSWYVGASLV